MHNLTDLLLNGMTTYGPVVLGITLLLGALGTPLPTSLLVVAAGAFAHRRANSFCSGPWRCRAG